MSTVLKEGLEPRNFRQFDAANEPPKDAGGFLYHLDDIERYANYREDLKKSSQIRFMKELGTESTRDGEIRRAGFVTEAGYAYSAVVGIAKEPVTDVPIIATSAWVTSTEGHNEHTMRKFMEAGNNVIFVGAEGSWRPDRFVKPVKPITLAGSAGAVLNFANVIAGNYKYLMDPVNRTVSGESRGAMVGMGLLALDELFGQRVLFADLTAPCFPRRFKPGDIALLAAQLYHEPASTARLAAKLTLKRLIHYPSTLDLNPYSIAHQLAIGPALFSGEAGDLARLISREKIVHITCFKNDKASMLHHWRKIFADHPNVQITPLEGSHLTLADPETLAFILGRNAAFQEAFSKKGLNITREDIFDPAHAIAEVLLLNPGQLD